jgi:prepilin-type N-terminal cleavage/methylation domain-containing protein
MTGLRSSAQRPTRVNGDSARTQRGFTMIELTMVVAIVFIVSAMLLPSAIVYLRTYKLRNDARALAGQLSFARMLASANTKRAMVSCDETKNVCQIWLRGLNDPSFVAATGSLQVTLSGSNRFGPPGTVGAGSATGSQSSTGAKQCDNIVFNSRGLPIYDSLAATAACVTNTTTDGLWVTNYASYIKDGLGAAIAIVVDPSGKANLYQWNGTLWNAIPD